MKKIIPVILFCFPVLLQAQYKNDNVKYQTVYMDDLCASLKKNKDYILLDVRSKGEHDDTSMSANLNIGHLKNAININVNELGSRLSEIKTATDKPVYVYCSHSQRSRVASAMLIDSGFTKVYNINGGLTTFNLIKETGIPCASSFYETGNKYKLLAPVDLLALLKKNKNVFLLDLRKDSVFNSISTNEMLNANGKLNNAINIPLEKVESSLSNIPKDKTVVLIDDGGNDSPKAADILFRNGYTDINIAFNGMGAWNGTPAKELSDKNKFWSTPAKYKLITADEFDELAKQPGAAIIDIRTVEEYNNKATDTWRNRGNVKGAISIPYTALESSGNKLSSYKDKPVFIYGFSTQQEAFRSAKLLSENGFTNVHVLIGGIWNLRWRAANIKGKTNLDKWVENVPVENL
jgi:rhodanese-related sulfurtransferase